MPEKRQQSRACCWEFQRNSSDTSPKPNTPPVTANLPVGKGSLRHATANTGCAGRDKLLGLK